MLNSFSGRRWWKVLAVLVFKMLVLKLSLSALFIDLILRGRARGKGTVILVSFDGLRLSVHLNRLTPKTFAFWVFNAFSNSVVCVTNFVAPAPVFYGCIKAKQATYWKWNCSKWRRGWGGGGGGGGKKKGISNFIFSPPPPHFLFCSATTVTKC